MKLNDKVTLKNFKLKNRIVMPPLVCFNWADDQGLETVDRGNHYGIRAKGGAGLIVVEATAISKEGRLANSMLGLWDRKHLNQFENIANECHKYDSAVLVQILHAGYQATTDLVYSASDNEDKKCKALSLEQIKQIKKDFVNTALLAKEAGLDGVEIHGAHTYLLNQFTTSKINKRNDIYGSSLENRVRLSVEVTKEIRQAVGNDFIIGYRYGVNDESFEDDIYMVKELEKAGVDFFNVSIGYSSLEIKLPDNFNHSPITYMGVKISQHTDKPTACVYGIRNADQAIDLIENHNVPLVAIGKGILADPEWGNKAINNENIDICFDCKPRCKFGTDGFKCPHNIRREAK